MPRHFLVYADGGLADLGIKPLGSRDGVRRRPVVTDDFNQRDQVRRIEGMAQHHAAGMAAGGLHLAHQQTRGTGSQDHMRRQRGIHAPEQVDLEVFALRAVFLHEVRTLERLFQRGRETQALRGGTGRQPQQLQAGPVKRHGGTQLHFRIRHRVGGRDLQPPRQEIGRPTGPDHAGAHHRYPAHLLLTGPSAAC